MKPRNRYLTLAVTIAISLLCALIFVGAIARAQDPTPTPPSSPPPPGGSMTITQTLSDEAQRNTIAFDGLAFLTGNLGADSFFPPGKVADFWGFQYLRDNDPTQMGHNTDFLTKAAFNMLYVLTTEQRAELITLAASQVDDIQQYALNRFVLMDAFHRLLEGNMPAGSTGLDPNAVKAYSGGLYQLDGEISYERAQIMGGILNALTAEQRAYLDAMVGQGMLDWPDVEEPEELQGLERAIKEAVMTYAGDLFSWYTGSVEADVYFCPERQGTYFGSFYMKDAPAVGNPGYSIPVTLTAEMGAAFLGILTPDQSSIITGLVDAQKPSLYAIVDRREDVTTQLRRFIAGETPDQTQVLALMDAYGALDGEIITRYATAFAQVGQSLTGAQQAELTALRTQLLGNLAFPSGAYLYAEPISMPTIPDSDFLFAGAATTTPTATPTATTTATATPTHTSTPVPTNTPTQVPPPPTPTRTQTGGIDSVSPSYAYQGQRGVLVTIALTTAPAPPQGVPSSVKIGALAGRNITRAGPVVTAIFDIPSTEPTGRKDVTVTFGATTTFTKAGSFEVRRR